MPSRATKWRGDPKNSWLVLFFAAATSGLPRRSFAAPRNDVYAFSKINFLSLIATFKSP
ncbi:hypothetical protein [Candidatus Tisiphia endosymbiont of Oplodontha viridula]|uniref:hypothetical protein n=1 Tax=Candidatus Tisiphia endosymbiont of Oplodontha viridula TaxID=3077925 RepID=UPI0035C8F9F4